MIVEIALFAILATLVADSNMFVETYSHQTGEVETLTAVDDALEEDEERGKLATDGDKRTNLMASNEEEKGEEEEEEDEEEDPDDDPPDFVQEDPDDDPPDSV